MVDLKEGGANPMDVKRCQINFRTPPYDQFCRVLHLVSWYSSLSFTEFFMILLAFREASHIEFSHKKRQFYVLGRVWWL